VQSTLQVCTINHSCTCTLKSSLLDLLTNENLSRVPERSVKCPGKVLTYVLRQENRKGSLAIVEARIYSRTHIFSDTQVEAEY